MDKFKFEQKVREHLQKQRYSQAEMARSLHVSRSTVNKWTTGENSIPYESLFALCELLKLPEIDRVELFALAGYQHIPIHTPDVAVGQSTRAHDAVLYTESNIAKRPEILFGRDMLLPYIEAMLAQGKHLLLTGYGGTGKTALASTIAGRWVEAGKGAVLWFVADSDDLDVVMESMTAPFDSSIDLASKKGDAKSLAVQSILSQAKVQLVIVDDLSRIKVLSYVRAAIPNGVPLLITSRYDAANVDISIKLVDLAPDEAVSLLAHHAQNRTVPVDQYRSDPQSAELCRRLGNHALGVVIAGAWLKQNRRNPHDLIRRLDEGNITALNVEMPLSTQQANRETVQKVLQQTYRAISNKSRSVFRAFGQLFEARATTHMIACIVDESSFEVESALDELVSWNFADREGSNVYSLHDLIYSYAVEMRRQRPEQKELGDMVARYTNEFGQDFSDLTINIGNIIAAAEMAEPNQRMEILRPVFLRGYGDTHGYRLELLSLLDQILMHLKEGMRAGACGARERDDLHFFLSKRGNAYMDRSAFNEAANIYEEALALAPNLERKVKLTSLVGKALAVGGNESGQAYLRSAYEMCGDDHTLRSFVLEQEAHAAGTLQDYVTAQRVAAEQVAINKRLLMAAANNGKAAEPHTSGTPSKSHESTDVGEISKVDPTQIHQVKIDLSRINVSEIEVVELLFYSLINLGTAELRLGKRPLPEVRAIHEEALEIANYLRQPEMIAHAAWSLAEVFHAEGDFDQASQKLIAAFETYQEHGKSRYAVEVQEFMRRHGYGNAAGEVKKQD